MCDEVSGTFTKLSHWPTTVDDDDLQMLERFVVIMYDRSSAATSVNDARLHLFARKQRPYDAIPPTSAALKEHIKVQPTKQELSGAKQLSLNQFYQVLQNGDGNCKDKGGW